MDEREIDGEIGLACQQLGIPLEETWKPTIGAHLAAIRAAIALVEGVPLADDAEQAPTFEA